MMGVGMLRSRPAWPNRQAAHSQTSQQTSNVTDKMPAGGDLYTHRPLVCYKSAEANNKKVSERTIAGNYLETKKHVI